MKSTITAFCLIIAFMALFLSCGTKEEAARQAVLTGRVTDVDTTIYLEGVKVFEKSHNLGSTTTDSAGFFRLAKVDFEEHNVYFEKEGYEPDTLWFEYNGTLERPVVTENVRLVKIGEEEPADTLSEP
jgi:hypothetical protein